MMETVRLIAQAFERRGRIRGRDVVATHLLEVDAGIAYRQNMPAVAR
jgi:hypothetical protein